MTLLKDGYVRQTATDLGDKKNDWWRTFTLFSAKFLTPQWRCLWMSWPKPRRSLWPALMCPKSWKATYRRRWTSPAAWTTTWRTWARRRVNPWPSFTGWSQPDRVTVESSTFRKRVVNSSSSLVEKLFPMTGTKCTRRGKLSSGFPRSASPDMLKVGCFYVFFWRFEWISGVKYRLK